MLNIKQNDNGLGLKATLSNASGVVDLNNATVDFCFKEHVIPCDRIDPANGVVIVPFDFNHTAETGKQRGVFKVQYFDGRRETFPSNGYVELFIQPNVGGN